MGSNRDEEFDMPPWRVISLSLPLAVVTWLLLTIKIKDTIFAVADYKHLLTV